MSLALTWGIACLCRLNMTKDMITNLKKIDRQKVQKIAKFDSFKNHIFRFLIISLVIFVLQEYTIPQIKAKDISFGPYSLSFLAKINILWERKRWNCLVFFPRTLEWSHKKFDRHQGNSRLKVFSVLLLLPIRKTNIVRVYNEAVFILFIGWRKKITTSPSFNYVFCNE